MPRPWMVLAVGVVLLLGSVTWAVAAGDRPAPVRSRPTGVTTRPAPAAAPATRPTTRATTRAATRRVVLSAATRATTRPVAAQTPVAPATRPVDADVDEAAAVAATQPAHGDVTELGEIDLIRVLKGEKSLTPEQVFQLGYWVDFAKDLVFGLLAFIPKLFVATLLFGIFYGVYRFVRRVLIGGMGKAGVDPSIREMLGSLLKWSILGFGLVIAGNQIGIQIAALLTGVSIIGLYVGFAAQTTLANFIAGVVIFWDKPFRVGDWVQVDGVFARVRRVTFRSTRLLNQDGEVVVFPNTAMLNTKLLNHTTEPLNRVTVPVRIRWEDSIDEARALLLSLLAGDRRICAAPVPAVVVESLGDSTVNLVLHLWVADESMVFDLRYEYLEKAKKALDAARAAKAGQAEGPVVPLALAKAG